MPFSLPLPRAWVAARWQIKIRDRERLEPPHATILQKTRAWRWDLREGRFMDREPDPREVPKAIVDVLRNNHARLQAEWDALYPENPVASEDDEHD